MAVGVNAPTEAELPPGARRDLMLALQRLYAWAGKPTVRTISDWILENDDLPSTLSRDFVSRTLRGDAPRWHNLKSLVHVLVEHQEVGASNVAAVLAEIHELWVLADASPVPRRRTRMSKPEEPERGSASGAPAAYRLEPEPRAEPEENQDELSMPQLPSDVVLEVEGMWRRGWLIGRELDGVNWSGVVQYKDGDGVERTERLPVNRIALPIVQMSAGQESSATSQVEADTELVSRLSLPSHILVEVDGMWRRGWLIGREHDGTGWFGVVQYEDRDGVERTDRLPGDRIALPDLDMSAEQELEEEAPRGSEAELKTAVELPTDQDIRPGLRADLEEQRLVRTLLVQVVRRLNEQRRRDQLSGVAPMSDEDERAHARSLIARVLEDDAGYEVAYGQPDQELVRKLRIQVAERLSEERRRDQLSGLPPMSAEDERQFARSLIARVLESHSRYELADGRTPPTPEDDAQIASAIHSALYGLGRLQPLLDDPKIENIDIKGCDAVFVRYRDGREEFYAPVADSDEELVGLIQVAAAHAGLASRPFDLANPRLDLWLPDGSRLSAVMGVTSRPEVSIHR